MLLNSKIYLACLVITLLSVKSATSKISLSVKSHTNANVVYQNEVIMKLRCVNNANIIVTLETVIMIWLIARTALILLILVYLVLLHLKHLSILAKFVHHILIRRKKVLVMIARLGYKKSLYT